MQALQAVSARPAQPSARAQGPRRAALVVSAAVPDRRSGSAAHPPALAAAAAATAARGCLAAAAAALLLAAHPGEAWAADVVKGYPRVVDGDTLDFSGKRVRLFGIDAPETKQSCTAAKGGEYMCGETSKEALAAKIGKAEVQCEPKPSRDKYGRIIGVCSVGKEDLNAWMVQQGLAVAYKQYGSDYVPQEEEARAAKRGIWNGTFEVPSRWRKDHPRGDSAGSAGGAAAPAAALVAAAPPPGCAIKGNISSSGEKVYHVPGGTYYNRTVIEPEKGEKFFCSEAEAQAAGWRKAAK